MTGAVALGARCPRQASRQRWPAQRHRWLSCIVQQDAIEFKHAPGRAGVELNAPPTWRKSFMNNRLLFALPLAAVTRFPGPCADHLVYLRSDSACRPQQTQSTSTDTSTATGKAPLAAPSREGFWGRVNPFARKKYVQRQTEPIRDRVNELDELTSPTARPSKTLTPAPRLASSWPPTRPTKPTSTPSMPATRPPRRSRPRSRSPPASRPSRLWLATSTSTRPRTRRKSASAPARPC